MRVRGQVPVGVHLGQVRRHPGRPRTAGPAGGDQPVGQRGGRIGSSGRRRSRRRPRSTQSTGSSTCAIVPWKSNSTASIGRAAAVGEAPAARRAPYRSRRTPAEHRPVARYPSGTSATALSSLVAMTSPAERYAAARRRAEQAARLPALTEFARRAPVRARPVPARGLRGAGAGQRGAGVRADRGRQDRGRRVRRAPGAGPGPQVLLHHADQGAVEPEVQRPGRAARRRPRSACSPATTRSTATRRWW